MHYYQFNIGNYRRKTGHLSMLEHGAYKSLIDTYYLEERPLCADHANLMRTHSARTDEEKKAIENVLSDFFTLTDAGYVHNDIEDNLGKYHKKSEKARKSAQTRWSNDANAMRTQCEGNANHKPLTTNQEPIKPTAEYSAGFVLFWTIYPKKVGKEAAYKAWKKLKPNTDAVLKALGWQVDSEQWLKDAGQFVPNPATYLNQGRWKDEPQATKSASNSKPWYITASGVEDKARELEIVKGRDELHPNFTARVLQKAGINQDMIRKANNDFRATS